MSKYAVFSKCGSQVTRPTFHGQAIALYSHLARSLLIMPRYNIQIDPEPDYTWVLVLVVLLAALFYSLLRPIALIVAIAAFVVLVWWLVRRLGSEGDEE